MNAITAFAREPEALDPGDVRQIQHVDRLPALDYPDNLTKPFTRRVFFQSGNVKKFRTMVSMDRVKTGTALSI
ncbi:MAG: hypothetical protein P8L68_19610 [Paracoccaceae bacterium]|nr:hypothetical protein [Paracoccaceae bacterium]MDG2260686.1 hypothetical protein [Paracoccaceae bacterium]